jgi:formylglycine-generating enzyme required for sulfatase activity
MLMRRMLVLGVALAAGTLTTLGFGFAQTPAAKKYAVLVGVQDYDHSKLQRLPFAVNDVSDLGDLLRRHGYQVTLLRTAATDAKFVPTLASINARLAEVLEQCKRHDTVLVALAGHGLQFEKRKPDDPDDAYFCPQDARPLPERRETLLSLRKLYRQLDDSGAGVKLLLVDACRDDPTVPRGVRRGVDGSTSPRPPRGVAALFSCSAGESAWESAKLKHGVFFYYVLEGLRGKAAAEGEVTWDGLQLYVRRRVTRDVAGLVGSEARQTPALNAGELAGEPPVLVMMQAPGANPDVQAAAGVRPEPARAPFNAPKAKALQQAWARYLGRKVEETVDLGAGVTMDFVLIPPATFTMGSPTDEKAREYDEVSHAVTITKPFFLGKYHLTQEQYQCLTGSNPSYFAAGGEGKISVVGQDTRRFPVEQVSWEDAMAYCDTLGRKISRPVRLPSEAEWEYACRAGTTTPFHFGTALNGAQANCYGDSPYGTSEKGPYLKRTCRVGSYEPNAFGLYDMHGNVWQWCQDWYGSYDGLPARDPLRVDKGAEGARVLRGGSWFSEAWRCRAARRRGYAPALRYNFVGFRVAFRLD